MKIVKALAFAVLDGSCRYSARHGLLFCWRDRQRVEHIAPKRWTWRSCYGAIWTKSNHWLLPRLAGFERFDKETGVWPIVWGACYVHDGQNVSKFSRQDTRKTMDRTGKENQVWVVLLTFCAMQYVNGNKYLPGEDGSKSTRSLKEQQNIIAFN